MIVERIDAAHQRLIDAGLTQLHRISIALIDDGYLRTYADSSIGVNPLRHHERRLCTAPSLQQLADSGQPRVVEDYQQAYPHHSKANAWLQREQIRSSYTVPLYLFDEFIGFVFFNSATAGYFSPERIEAIQPELVLIERLVQQERVIYQRISALCDVAEKLCEIRDMQTSLHCQRLKNITRVIANHMVQFEEMSDRIVYYTIKFSPLHDIGKVGVADNILQKPGPLSSDEYREVKRHVEYGLNVFIGSLSAQERRHEVTALIEQLIGLHHEQLNGQGYPVGLTAEQIPIPVRMVTVADIFDALTSDRPYKPAWSIAEAIAQMYQMAEQDRIDGRCVDALAIHYQQQLQDFRQLA
ncbi:HD domain-containing phosphohydrolase [uncultured Ferrimonas sp.]|uniref:HD domain-containing phosphohydrolase n=1 Tax=uncultured Ferrimonas sp. TaxID=432640 RepID=UPI002637746A|nr:HD domain-containing phosphohydrolase [uncultured Ferrimonas sp.]